MKILVAEKKAINVGSVSNFSNPNTPDFCSRKDCFVCMTADKPTKGICWREGTAFRLECQLCLSRGIRTVYH